MTSSRSNSATSVGHVSLTMGSPETGAAAQGASTSRSAPDGMPKSRAAKIAGVFCASGTRVLVTAVGLVGVATITGLAVGLAKEKSKNAHATLPPSASADSGPYIDGNGAPYSTQLPPSTATAPEHPTFAAFFPPDRDPTLDPSNVKAEANSTGTHAFEASLASLMTEAPNDASKFARDVNGSVAGQLPAGTAGFVDVPLSKAETRKILTTETDPQARRAGLIRLTVDTTLGGGDAAKGAAQRGGMTAKQSMEKLTGYPAQEFAVADCNATVAADCPDSGLAKLAKGVKKDQLGVFTTKDTHRALDANKAYSVDGFRAKGEVIVPTGRSEYCFDGEVVRGHDDVGQPVNVPAPTQDSSDQQTVLREGAETPDCLKSETDTFTLRDSVDGTTKDYAPADMGAGTGTLGEWSHKPNPAYVPTRPRGDH
jgi:hypothetical protein